MEEKTDNDYVQYIGQYLIEYITEHPGHAEAILAEGKTVEGSFKHMESVARKKKKSGMVMLTPEEGFKAVMEYFGIENVEVAPEKMGVTQKVVNIGTAKRRKVDISLDDLL
jgi:hypothetical protein